MLSAFFVLCEFKDRDTQLTGFEEVTNKNYDVLFEFGDVFCVAYSGSSTIEFLEWRALGFKDLDLELIPMTVIFAAEEDQLSKTTDKLAFAI